MKKIGITGSYGKTSVCEIIYQYLLKLGKTVVLYCTNGIFKNGKTINKNMLTTSLPKIIIEKFLEKEDSEYAIIEIKGELFKTGKYIDLDIIGITNFDKELVNNFDNNVVLYSNCKNKALHTGKISLVPENLKDEFYYTKTYKYLDTFKDWNKHQVENISLAIAILKELDLYKLEVFPEIKIRGRYEKFGNIIVDTGWCGFEHIYPMYKENKIKLIYVPIYPENISPAVKIYRDTAKPYLSKCEKIYVTSSTNERSFDYFRKNFLEENYENVEYIKEHKDCLEKALKELKDDELLFIMAREYFREFRSYLK